MEGFGQSTREPRSGGADELTEHHSRKESNERHENVGEITQAVFFLSHGRTNRDRVQWVDLS